MPFGISSETVLASDNNVVSLRPVCDGKQTSAKNLKERACQTMTSPKFTDNVATFPSPLMAAEPVKVRSPRKPSRDPNSDGFRAEALICSLEARYGRSLLTTAELATELGIEDHETLGRIPEDQLPRIRFGGRAGTRYLAIDIAWYMVRLSKRAEKQAG